MKFKVVLAIAIGIAILLVGGIEIEKQTISNPTTNPVIQNSSQAQPIGKKLFLNLTDSVNMKTK